MNKIMPLLLLINTFVLGQDVPAKDIAIADELKKSLGRSGEARGAIT